MLEISPLKKHHGSQQRCGGGVEEPAVGVSSPWAEHEDTNMYHGRRGEMSRFCHVAVVLLLALPAIAQPQSFEAVTIKPARSADPGDERVQVLPNGNMIARSVALITLLSYAYDVPVNPTPRLSALPDWAIHEKYDIAAKAPANALSPRLQSGEVRTRTQQMIRRLLADRFRLVLRVENKSMSVYALTLANGGSKLQRSATAERDCIFDTTPAGCHNFVGGYGHPLNATAIDMDDLAHYIENWTDLPVVNRTALSGLFTINSEGWRPMQLPPPPPNAAPQANPFAGLPSIFTVLDKFSLALKRQKQILPVYTVERIERPTAN